MQQKLLLSIITVNLNNLEGLKKTVQSVFEQTWREFEYIIIDGGSTDGSKEFIETHYDKIDYWVSEMDSGIYNAMNKGIKVANGEYLLFLNSGDELYNPSVFEENKNLIHTEDLVYFDISLIFPGHTKIHNYPGILSFKTFMEGSIGHPTTFIKRNLFEKIGLYDEKLQIVADWKFFAVAVVKNNCSRRKVDAVLSKFYMDGISSVNGKTVEEERKRVMKCSFPFRSFIYQNKSNFQDSKFIPACKAILKRIYRINKGTDWVKMKRFIKKNFKILKESKSLNELTIFIRVCILRLTKRPLEINPNDARTFPIIIISFNQLYHLRQLIKKLEKWGYKNIVIIDNNSTYEPLIQYLEEIKERIVIHRLKNNYGHKVFWERKEFFKLYGKNYYVVTDPDILPDEECPHNFLRYFKRILDSNPQVTKVGFSLRLEDIPESNTLKEKILQWEAKFWKEKDDEGNYLAEIDTTFALYRPRNMEEIERDFFKAIRTKPPYIARHGGWYIDFNNLLPEQENYMRTAGVSSSWRVNSKGINNHPRY